MRVGYWIGLATAAYVAIALVRSAEGQLDTARLAGCVGSPPPEIGAPRLIPGFDLTSVPPGKVVISLPLEIRLREVLAEPVEFSLAGTKLKDFAAELGAKYKIEVSLDDAALKAEDKTPDLPLTGRARSATLRSALQEILYEQDLAFVTGYGSLLITTRTASQLATPTRVYQVHDLVVKPNDPANVSDFESLIELLTSMIAPETWREAGGTQGEVKPYHGPGAIALVVTQTDDMHDQIERLFADLRASQSPEIYRLQQQRMRRATSPHPFYNRN